MRATLNESANEDISYNNEGLDFSEQYRINKFKNLLILEPPLQTNVTEGISQIILSNTNYYIAEFSSKKYLNLLRNFLENEIYNNDESNVSEKNSGHSQYNIDLHCEYHLNERIIDQIIAVGFSTGASLFVKSDNSRLNDCNSSSGILGAAIELTIASVLFNLIEKTNDALFLKQLSKAKMSTILVPQYYLQYTHDINTVERILEYNINTPIKNIKSHLNINTSFSTNSFNLIENINKFPEIIARWCLNYNSLQFKEVYYTVKKIFGTESLENDCYYSEDDDNLVIHNIVSQLRGGIDIEGLCSNEPQRMCNAIQLFSNFQKLWYSINGISQYHECTPYEFITFKNPYIIAHPIMFGIHSDYHTKSYNARFNSSNEQELYYSLMYSLSLKYELMSDLTKKFLKWTLYENYISYPTKIVGTHGFRRSLMSIHHGNDLVLCWFTAIKYDQLKNELDTNIENSGDNGSYGIEDIASASLIGVRKNKKFIRFRSILKSLIINIVDTNFLEVNKDTIALKLELHD